MSPSISPPAFTRFPDLPVELQVMVINHALNEDIKQRKGKLVLSLYSSQPHEANAINDSNDPSKSTAPPPIRLPKLPSAYHTTRLFRTEALRIYPLHQLFANDCLDIPDPRGSLVVFDPTQDTVVFNIYGRCSNLTPFDRWRLFDLIKSASPSPKLECLFVVVAKTRKLAAEIYYIIMENVWRVSVASFVSLNEVAGEVGMWHVVQKLWF